MSGYFIDPVDRHEYEMYEHEIAEAHAEASADTTPDHGPHTDLDIRRTSASQPPPAMRNTGGQYGTSNTGSKGVQADYRDSKQIMINKHYRDNLRHERTIQQSAGVNTTPTVTQMEAMHSQLTQSGQLPTTSKHTNKLNDDDSDTDSDFSDDDDILAKLRADRMQHIQNQLPVYGTYDRVTLQEYSTIVKGIEAFVYCVAHVYSNNVQACTRLNLSFEALAERFTHVRFVRIRMTDAMPGYNPAGLPTLLVYKGGEMVESAVRVTNALPGEFTDYDVACLLQSKSILKVPTGESELKMFERREQLASERKAFVLSSAHKGYDSDE